jgi:nitrite reductase/ring-hydroxylating ferredoxin subunit
MFQRAAKLSDLVDDDILAVEVAGVEMVIYRHGDAIRACQRYCPHQRSDLTEGLVSRGFLICSAHGWRFDADSGVHELSPETCLATYQTMVEGQDILINPTPIRNGAVPRD